MYSQDFDFYKEMRRQEALERLQEKAGTTSSASPVDLVSEFLIPTKRPERLQKKEITIHPHRTPRKRVQLTCIICGEQFETTPSLSKRRQTCLQKECTKKIRSLKQKARNKAKEPKQCENPKCFNFLNNDRVHHSQKKYCSIRCSLQHRHNLSPNYKESLDNFSRGDYVEARRGKSIFRGWVGGFSVGANSEKRISLLDESGKRMAQVALSKSRKIQ
jgi:hypothetical protein